MNKQEFIKKLKKKLSGLPKAEIKERLAFYCEMIDDRIEEGLTEKDAVAAVGDIDGIALQIKNDRNLDGDSERVDSRKISTGEWLLIIIASPIWLPLFLAALAVMVTVYAVLWSVIVAVWAVELPFFAFSYISKYLFIFCKKSTKYIALFTKNTFFGFFRSVKGGKKNL